jgi:glyceraldehyde 3-phosphate dehydrogenase
MKKVALVDSKHFLFFHEKAFQLRLKSINIDYVIESTENTKLRSCFNAHIVAGAKKVILSAPSEVDSKTVVLGVMTIFLMERKPLYRMQVIITNNAAPSMMKVIDELWYQTVYITTIHSYTTDQSLYMNKPQGFFTPAM